MRLRSGAAFLLTLAVCACGTEKQLPGMGSGKDGPAIGFSSPNDGEEILSSSVWVTVDTREFSLAPDAMGAERNDGEGHYHFYVNGSAAGESGQKSFLVTDLAPGDHEITARLFHNDHQPVEGAKPARVTVTIPANAPRVSIQNPQAGATIGASSVELTLAWENYASGRWHAYVDGLDGEPHGIAEDPTSVVTELSPGKHLIYVRLHHSGGDPFEPEVLDTVPVTIPDWAPSIRISQPAEGATITRTETIHVEAQNFEIDGNAAGGEPQEGEGHFHVYVDGYDSGHMWQEGYHYTVNLANVPPGERDIYVRLMNNDHTSIEPKIVDRVRVIVQ